MKANAIIFEATNKVAVRSISLPELRDGEVLIETCFSGISPGTELRTLAGKEKNADPFPLIPGYSTVGRIIGMGKKVTGLKEGTIAYIRGCRALNGLGCSWGGHCSHLVAPQEEVFILPKGADSKKGTLTALLATALHGVDLTNARIREQVAVVGLGLVGQLCARLFRYAGVHVVGTDMLEHRRHIARQAGITTVDFQSDLREAFRPHFPFGAEAVLDATGSPKAMKGSLSLLRENPRQDPCGSSATAGGPGQPELSAFDLLRKQTHLQNSWHGPRLIAQGSYGDPIEINYYDVFNNEVKFIVPRVHETKDVFRALELLADPNFNLDGLFTRTARVSEAPALYQELRDNPSTLITACFSWAGA